MVLKRNLEIVQTNIPLLNSFFDSDSDLFSWYQLNAGPISFVRMKFGMDDMAFANKVVKEKSVFLLSADVYDYKEYFRIGFGRKNTPEALAKIEEFVKENLLK